MLTLADKIRELESAAEHPAAAVKKEMKDTGKKAVGCFPIYAPEELVHAAGMIPVGMWGGQTQGSMSDRYLQSFCCSIMKADTEQLLNGTYDMLSGIILNAYCDTMKCTMENWKTAEPKMKLIPMVYPQNRKIEAGRVFMEDELARVLAELEKIAGVTVDEKTLQASVDLFDNYRREMQRFVKLAGIHFDRVGAESRHKVIKAAYFLDKERYLEKIKEINEELESLPEASGAGKKRVILTGLISEPSSMLSLLDENGLVVAGDDLAQEERQFRCIAPEKDSALRRMANRVAMQDGCAFLYDESKSRGRHLTDLAGERMADGVIICQLKFCDPEEFDYPIYKKELEQAEIPMLYLELEQKMDSIEQLRTRIQSFVEMLS